MSNKDVLVLNKFQILHRYLGDVFGKVLSYKKEIESSKRSNSNAILWLKKERGSILKAEDIYSDLESLLVNFESIVETYEKVEGGRLKK